MRNPEMEPLTIETDVDTHVAAPRNKLNYDPNFEEMGPPSQTGGSSSSSSEEDRFDPANSNRGNQGNDEATRLVQQSLQTMVAIMEQQFNQQKEHEEDVRRL